MLCYTACCHSRFSPIFMLFQSHKLCIYIPSPLSQNPRHTSKTAQITAFSINRLLAFVNSKNLQNKDITFSCFGVPAAGVNATRKTSWGRNLFSRNCHGSWVPDPILTVSCLCACAYVWAGVCGCVWLRLIRSSWESSPLGYICSCHALSFVRSLQCLRSSFTVRSGSAIPEPCCFLDSDRRTLAAHCFPALPASALRKAPHLPTESSVSAYGSSASALRKAPFLPTEAPPLPYGKLRFCLRKLRLCPTESSV